jgi:hypothetical protein
MGATELTLAHIFRVGSILVLNFAWNRSSPEQAFE